MKIEKIETWLVDRWLTVRVTCDDGTYGVGEGNFWSYAEASEKIAHRVIEDLRGTDARDLDRIWNQVYRKYSFRSPALTAAMSAIDVALWDIRGKRLQAPVWELLGGKYRDRVRAIPLLGAFGTLEDPATFVAAARKVKTAGYTALKMTPFPKGWGLKTYPDLIRGNTAIVEAVREEVGWEFDIGIEIHRNMSPSESVVFARQIEKFLPYFFEDPIAPDSVLSMGDVGRQLNLPLAVGERNNTLWEFREYCQQPGVAFLKPDLGLAGGFTHVRKIAAMAESFHIRMAPHHFLGPITTMALVHIAAATPNWDVNEFNVEEDTFREQIVTDIAQVKGGYFQIPETPGLGTDIVVEEMVKHPRAASAGETAIRPDGSTALR
ncbi:MAG: mandelate racemase/muconate lactonizing enzyme family protein [Dehalococcoidia bacterium]|nr:mandelate racemase/muconate lactonizing enzyme family protein [Dehalococcoidia bacterium]